MNNLLNPCAEATKKKQVTFDETALDPRVIPPCSIPTTTTNTARFPQLIQADSATSMHNRAASAPRVTSIPMTTRSKYAKALAYSITR